MTVEEFKMILNHEIETFLSTHTITGDNLGFKFSIDILTHFCNTDIDKFLLHNNCKLSLKCDSVRIFHSHKDIMHMTGLITLNKDNNNLTFELFKVMLIKNKKDLFFNLDTISYDNELNTFSTFEEYIDNLYKIYMI